MGGGALPPLDTDGLVDFVMVGLHVISVLLLNELHEATEEPDRAAILQRLAILAEHRAGTPLAD